MRYAATPQVSKLTGLSTAKLREWTSRRALIPADVPPKRKGSPAKFKWQTVLILRIAVILRDRFYLELHAHRTLFASLRQQLRDASFVGLWNKLLVLNGSETWALIDEADAGLPPEDALTIRLNPHLEALAAGFAFPHPTAAPSQLELFPAHAVRGLPSRKARRRRARAAAAPSTSTRRRSA